MAKPIAYIETTIPNFYYDFRPDPEIVARRHWTREWWAIAAESYEMRSSEVVIEELSAGTSPLVAPRLQLIKGLPLLALVPEVAVVEGTYIRHKLMPAKPRGDAMHLALASFHRCDFIVSWNCRHLANPNKFKHVRTINQRLGLPVPKVVTPLNLLERMR